MSEPHGNHQSGAGPQAIRESLRRRASEEGFTQFAVTAAMESPGFNRLGDWIEAGYAGEMHYFQQRREAYQHPQSVLAGVRSIVVLAFPYARNPRPKLELGEGRLARYLWSGDDYHDVIHRKLKGLTRYLKDDCGATSARGVVDTAPLMEREWAELSGMGWRGKNTLLLRKGVGSYFFLACLLTDLQLPLDAGPATDHCGTCRRCLDACPTDAFPAAGVMDATKCISYLTIEHRGPIPRELRLGVGDWLFGCDICQEVCPWNEKVQRVEQRSRQEGDAHSRLPRERLESVGGEPECVGGEEDARLAASMDRLELAPLFELDDEAFRTRFRKTPLWRAKRRGLLRNAAIVLGNSGDGRHIKCLGRGLEDEEPVVRGACAWALGRLGERSAWTTLMRASECESDPEVLGEIFAAIDDWTRQFAS